MEMFEFKTKEKSSDGRSYLVAFPANKIEKIESIDGGQNVYLKVNNIEVEGSYESLIRELTSLK